MASTTTGHSDKPRAVDGGHSDPYRASVETVELFWHITTRKHHSHDDDDYARDSYRGCNDYEVSVIRPT